MSAQRCSPARLWLAFASRALACTCAASSLAVPARANFAPVARAAVTPSETSPGTSITFSSGGSIDPDEGPQPLSFTWDFGDDAGSTDASPTHAYTSPGLYQAKLTLSDGDRTSLAFVDVGVLPEPLPDPSARSAPIVLDAAGQLLYVVNPDSDTVSVVDTSTLAVIAEVATGDDPRALALSKDGARLFVACRGDGSLLILDSGSLVVLGTATVGHQAVAVVVSPTDGRVLVTDQTLGTLTVLAPDGGTVLAVVDVGMDARAIAVTADGTKAYVSRFLTRGDTGIITVVDLATYALTGTIPLVEDPGPDTPSSGRGFPNLLDALAVDPAGRFLWVGGLKANTGRGMYRSGEPLVPRNRLRGLMARVPTTSIDEDVTRRIDTNDADAVSAIAFSPSGRFVYAAHPGAGLLSIYDVLAAEGRNAGDGDVVSFASRTPVGHQPAGIAVAPDGSRVYVAGLLSRDVTVLDVADASAPVVVATIPATAEPLDPRVANGKRLFYRSAAPRHSLDNYIACASCHPDDGFDGRTWDFTQSGEGLRNTIDLRGRGGTADGPVHWSANFDEIQDFENDIVYGFGGTGLADDGALPHPPLDAQKNGGRSTDLDDLALYVASLTASATSPFRSASGEPSAAASRGRAVFLRDDVGCATCHALPRLSDSVLVTDAGPFVLHDVGTLTEASGGRLGGALSGLDTPSLIGAWATAPYLHDGSAATLREVVTTRNAENRHGVTSQLDEAEINDLVAYLQTIDREETIDAPDGGILGDDAGTVSSDGGVRPADGGVDPGDGQKKPGGDGCGCASAKAPAGTTLSAAAMALLMLVFSRTRPPLRAAHERRQRLRADHCCGITHVVVRTAKCRCAFDGPPRSRRPCDARGSL